MKEEEDERKEEDGKRKYKERKGVEEDLGVSVTTAR